MAGRTMTDWWRNGAVYQIYPRSYQDSDGDGIGDLRGIERRLDHVAALGVDAIWLSPVHPSPQADFGYDVADYRGVDPVFGSLADLDALIAAAHHRGLKVLLDGVFNHTSDQHPWFVESRSSRTNPKRDWYLWRDRIPNNWASTFGGPAWSHDAATDAWYLHSFLPAQPDLNWRHEPVVDAVCDVLRYWFERGVDGFRLDVFNCYLKDPELRTNPRRWHPGGLLYGFIGQHHVHDRDQPDLGAALGRMRAVAHEFGALLVGETLDERFHYDRAASYVGAGQLHQAFHFALLHSRWTTAALAAAIRRQIESLPPDGWPTWVLSNHDFRRHPTRWGGGDARAKAAAVLALTLPGTPYLYYGEEIGMVEGRLTRDQIVDPPGRRFWPFFKGRDGARTPMQWTADGGFTTGAPWLPVNPDVVTRNAASQMEDPRSILATYRAVLALRRIHLTDAAFHLDVDQGPVLSYRRGALRVAIHTRSTTQRWSPPEPSSKLLFTTGAGEPGTLGPDEASIWMS